MNAREVGRGAREEGDVHSPAHASHGETGHGHGEYAPVFTPGSARRKELDEVLTRYPTKMAALLPALWMVQHERGWVSEAGMAEVAEVLELTPAYVKGVVTFYTMYHQHPVGRYFIQVCTTSPCNVCGAEDVVDALVKHTGCHELGQTSPDGRYTVIEVECLGACGFATPIMINEDFIESVTPEKVPELLLGLK
jgi:NADH-quinone oxidoreductase E subunit